MSKKFSKFACALAVPTAMLAGGTAQAMASAEPLDSTGILATEQSWQTCETPLIEQPYSPFGDTRDYVLAPGGSFEQEGAPGWQFTGDAEVDGGDDALTQKDLMVTALNAGKLKEKKLLELEEGSSVVSPAMCVDLNYPMFRMTSKADDDAVLKVEVIYPNAPEPAFQEMATIAGREGDFSSSKWYASGEIGLSPELGGAEWGGRLMALRITAVSEDWKIDDIYIDPRRYS
jgi:hypothetical protein